MNRMGKEHKVQWSRIANFPVVREWDRGLKEMFVQERMVAVLVFLSHSMAALLSWRSEWSNTVLAREGNKRVSGTVIARRPLASQYS